MQKTIKYKNFFLLAFLAIAASKTQTMEQALVLATIKAEQQKVPAYKEMQKERKPMTETAKIEMTKVTKIERLAQLTQAAKDAEIAAQGAIITMETIDFSSLCI